MANPGLKTIAADTWVKVATATQIGQVRTRLHGPDSYLYDYRLTGQAAPVGLATAQRFDKSGIENISSNTPIDVYVYASNSIGSVLVSL